MKVLLLQLDGKYPNIALMRLSAHHKRLGDDVELRRLVRPERVERGLFDDVYDRTYASLIFTKTIPVAQRLQQLRPDAIIGGTGWDDYLATPPRITSLEQLGVHTLDQDYSLYPTFRSSIGFTQRGCRMNSRTCPFCVVPYKEGKVRAEQTVEQLWRRDQFYYDPATKGMKPCPRELLLLDNDFFGNPQWRELLAAIKDGGFKVSFSQGINARMLNDEAAEAIASIDYRDDRFNRRCIHTAWDNRGDEKVLFRGLNALVRYGVKPENITVYFLVGYWKGETEADWLYRHDKLREFGARPYPMPYIRTTQTIGFQRWVVRAHDKTVNWQRYTKARYRPEKLGYPEPELPFTPEPKF